MGVGKIKQTAQDVEGRTTWRASCRPRSASFPSALPRQPGSSRLVLAGQVPSLPPHLLGSRAPGFPKRRPSDGNGNSLNGSFLSVRLPQPDPKDPKSGGREIPTRSSPTPARFCLWLTASLAPMPPRLVGTSGWPTGGGGGELRGSGLGNGAG